MRHLLMVVGLTCALVLPSLAADSFYLVTKSGEKIGPIEFKEGESVKVGKQELKIEKGVTENERLKAVLEGIKIPVIGFKQADVREVFGVLDGAIQKYGTNEHVRVAPACRINLASNIVTSTNGAIAVNDESESGEEYRVEVRPFSFDARSISFWDALWMITESMGLRCVATNGNLLVIGKHEPDSPIIQRFYELTPDFAERANFYELARGSGSSATNGLKGFFRVMGVEWPRGSSIKHVKSIGKLVVFNTKENLERFERAFDALAPRPNQVEVEVKFISFSKEDIAKASQTGRVSVAVLAELDRQGKGLLLAVPRAITKSGAEFTVKGVREYIYPTEFYVSQGAAGASNHVDSVVDSGPVVEPDGFETREVGAILQCMPELTIDGQMINLCMAPQYVFEPTWRDYGPGPVDGDGHGQQVPMEQPFFATATLSTSISMLNGQTILLGGGVPDADGKRLVYTLVTARRVTPDGEPVPVVKRLDQSAAADGFCLVAPSGEKIGPIEFKEGETVKVGKQELKIEKGVTDAKRVRALLEGIEIPVVSFKQADVSVVLKFLDEAIQKYGTNGHSSGVASCAIRLAPNIETSTNESAVAEDGSVEKRVTTVTIATQRMSVWEALQIVVYNQGLRVAVENGSVMVVDKEEPDSPIVTRYYPVIPDIVEDLQAALAEGEDLPIWRNDDSQDFFRSMGVDFPRGAYIRHSPALGILVAANTLENLKTLERVFEMLNVVPNQLEIEAKFISFSKGDIAKLSQTGMVSRGVLEELNRQGKGLLLAAPQMITRSGAECTIKGVTEYIYPTEFSVSRSGSNANDQVESTVPSGAIAEPGGFETREVGAIFQCMPELTTDGQMINLTIAPQFVFEPTWRDYGQRTVEGKGHGQRVPMEQPFFGNTTISTSISMYNGQTILLGGGVPDRDDQRLVYTFVTVRQVGPDGQPIPVKKWPGLE